MAQGYHIFIFFKIKYFKILVKLRIIETKYLLKIYVKHGIKEYIFTHSLLPLLKTFQSIKNF